MINAGKETVTTPAWLVLFLRCRFLHHDSWRPHGSYCSRRFEVTVKGDIAKWMIPGKLIKGQVAPWTSRWGEACRRSDGAHLEGRQPKNFETMHAAHHWLGSRQPHHHRSMRV